MSGHAPGPRRDIRPHWQTQHNAGDLHHDRFRDSRAGQEIGAATLGPGNVRYQNGTSSGYAAAAVHHGTAEAADDRHYQHREPFYHSQEQARFPPQASGNIFGSTRESNFRRVGQGYGPPSFASDERTKRRLSMPVPCVWAPSPPHSPTRRSPSVEATRGRAGVQQGGMHRSPSRARSPSSSRSRGSHSSTSGERRQSARQSRSGSRRASASRRRSTRPTKRGSDHGERSDRRKRRRESPHSTDESKSEGSRGRPERSSKYRKGRETKRRRRQRSASRSRSSSLSSRSSSRSPPGPTRVRAGTHNDIANEDAMPATAGAHVAALEAKAAVAIGSRAAADDSDEEDVGPKVPSSFDATAMASFEARTSSGSATSAVGGLAASGYGGGLRPGEGQAIAAFVESGQRVPRRGEVGWSSTDIDRLETAGYVMSGSRHKRMNEVRLRKESQVYTAQEKKALALFSYEQKQEREKRLMDEFRALAAASSGADERTNAK